MRAPREGVHYIVGLIIHSRREHVHLSFCLLQESGVADWPKATGSKCHMFWARTYCLFSPEPDIRTHGCHHYPTTSARTKLSLLSNLQSQMKHPIQVAQGPVFDPKSTPATNPTPLSMKVENIPPGRSPLPGGDPIPSVFLEQNREEAKRRSSRR